MGRRPQDGELAATLSSSPGGGRLYAAAIISNHNHDHQHNLLSAKVQLLRPLLNNSNQGEPAQTRRHWDHRLDGRLGQRCLWRPSFHPVDDHTRGSRHLLYIYTYINYLFFYFLFYYFKSCRSKNWIIHINYVNT